MRDLVGCAISLSLLMLLCSPLWAFRGRGAAFVAGSAVGRSNNRSYSDPGVRKENKDLRKENKQLNKELDRLRNDYEQLMTENEALRQELKEHDIKPPKTSKKGKKAARANLEPMDEQQREAFSYEGSYDLDKQIDQYNALRSIQPDQP